MRNELVNVRDLHLLTWNAECIRAGEEHHHRCGNCGEFHEPNADEAALIYRIAQNPGDPCCLDDEGHLDPTKVWEAFGMTVSEFVNAVAKDARGS